MHPNLLVELSEEIVTHQAHSKQNNNDQRVSRSCEESSHFFQASFDFKER